jgi:hypothetical protein
LYSSDLFGQKKRKKKAESVEIITTNIQASGTKITLNFTKGPSHNYPMMAAWLEDENGNYLQTLYVNQSVAKGYFNYADKNAGEWKPGPLVRPAALPVWSHKRGVKSDEGHYMPTQKNPMPDAVTSATPKAGFVLESAADKKLSGKFRVMFEINQSWDWNEFWTNNKYPDDEEYKTSAQPSVVYAVQIDTDDLQDSYEMKPIGHGHYSGKDGVINNDLSTITSALKIADKITVVVSSK